MATVTRTVTVNAAFLQEIKEDSTTLRAMLATLRRLAGNPSDRPGQVARFVRLLGELRDQVALHFSLEEAYGYFEDAIIHAPQLSNQAERLRAQHEVLFCELCTLVESSEELLYVSTPPLTVPRSIVQGFRSFDRQLRLHERAENELILQAFDDDLGVGD